MFLIGNKSVFSSDFGLQNSMFFNTYFINFYRRSLLGTILDLMNVTISVTNIFIIKFIFNTIFIHQFYKIFVKNFHIKLFFSLILFTPFLLNIIHREEKISDLLIIVCFLISVRTFLKKKFFLSILFILFGILSHEAYLFVFLPINFYMFSKTKFFSFLSIVVLISVYFILTSNHDNHSLHLLEERVKSYGFSVSGNWNEFFKKDLKGNVLYSIGKYLEKSENLGLRVRILFHIPMLFIYTFMYLYFLKFTRIKEGMSFYKIVLIINFLLLISLSLMGHDISRWFSLFLFNSLIIKFLYNNDLNKRELNNFILFNSLTILLGPLGDIYTFPYFIAIIKKVLLII